MEVTINRNPETFKSYSIYLITIDEDNKYFLSLPDKNYLHPSLALAFSSHYQNSSNTEEVRKEITEISDKIQFDNQDMIIAMPLIPYESLKEASKTNDYYLYQRILTKLHTITIDINRKVTNQNLNISLNQVIIIITQNDIDKNLADWLTMSFGSKYFKSLSLDQKEKSTPIEQRITPIIQESYYDSGDDGNSGLNLNGSISNENVKVLAKVPPKPSTHHGFSSFSFILVTLILSIIIGITIAVLIIK